MFINSVNGLSQENPEQVELSKKELVTSDFTSPYSTDALYILSTGMLVSTILGNDDRNLDQQAKAQAEFDPPLKDFGYLGETLGWGYLNLLYVAGFAMHGYFKQNNLSKERAEIMFSSSTFTLLTTSILKVTVKRARPSFPSKEDSFPSGHASMSFNFASVVAAEHGTYWGIPAYALASFISYSRVNDGWHWVSDVLVGATIGASYGWGVHLNRRNYNQFIFSFIPSVSSKGLIANLSGTF